MAHEHICCNKEKVNKGFWSLDEDEKLKNYIYQNDHGCWSTLPQRAGLKRCGKSCRLRWINYLRPDLKKEVLSAEEICLLFELHNIFGNKWCKIAKRMPGRTDNEIKNFWHSSMKRKLFPHYKTRDVNKSVPEPSKYLLNKSNNNNNKPIHPNALTGSQVHTPNNNLLCVPGFPPVVIPPAPITNPIMFYNANLTNSSAVANNNFYSWPGHFSLTIPQYMNPNIHNPSSLAVSSSNPQIQAHPIQEPFVLLNHNHASSSSSAPTTYLSTDLSLGPVSYREPVNWNTRPLQSFAYDQRT